MNVTTLNHDFEKLLNATEVNIKTGIGESSHITDIAMTDEESDKSVPSNISLNSSAEESPSAQDKIYDMPLLQDSGQSTHDQVWKDCQGGIPFQHRNLSSPLVGRTPQQTKLWIFEVCHLVSERSL